MAPQRPGLARQGSSKSAFGEGVPVLPTSAAMGLVTNFMQMAKDAMVRALQGFPVSDAPPRFGVRRCPHQRLTHRMTHLKFHHSAFHTDSISKF